MKKNLQYYLLFAFIFIFYKGQSQTFKAHFYYTVDCKKIKVYDTSKSSVYYRINWDFGDEIQTSDYNPSHIYNTGNDSVTFKVVLTILKYDSTLNMDITDTTSKLVTINCPGCNFKADFNAAEDVSNFKKQYFTNLTSGGSSLSYWWDFGNSSGTSTLKDPDYTYATKGNYDVTLKAMYYDSTYTKYCRDSITKLVVVNSLEASYTYTIDTSDCSVVHFTNTSLGNPAFFSWYFGDGGASNQANPQHEYLANDTFEVVFMVYDSIRNGRVYADTTFGQVVINCNKCYIRANLSLYADSTVPYSATLYNYSTGTINKHYWDFGDGSTSTSRNPVHSYSITGNITLMYIATDTTSGCADTAYLNFTIDSLGYLKRQAFVMTIVDRTSTGIDKGPNNLTWQLKAYPNPFNDQIIIKGDELPESHQLKVYNSLGQIVTYNSSVNGNQLILNFDSGLPSGFYVIRISTEYGYQHLKLIKE
ncbi:MAG: PKD domain-containing protein [Bacteroidota bacterium]